jgi:hypothetical protein
MWVRQSPNTFSTVGQTAQLEESLFVERLPLEVLRDRAQLAISLRAPFIEQDSIVPQEKVLTCLGTR